MGWINMRSSKTTKLSAGHLLSIGATVGFAFLLAFTFSLPNDAWSADRPGGVQAKLAYCEDCHGRAAQGFHGYYPIPRLAGQQTEYLKNQLQAFIEHRRTNNVMFNVAHSLSPAMMD